MWLSDQLEPGVKIIRPLLAWRPLDPWRSGPAGQPYWRVAHAVAFRAPDITPLAACHEHLLGPVQGPDEKPARLCQRCVTLLTDRGLWPL